MDYSAIYSFFDNLSDLLTGPDGFAYWSLFIFAVGFIFGFLASILITFLGDLLDILHSSGFFIRKFIYDKKAKSVGDLSNRQRLEILESKLDSVYDILNSSNKEDK